MALSNTLDPHRRSKGTDGLGPYSVHFQALNGKLDGRTKEARILKSTRKEVAALLGHRPNAAELAMIEQIAWLQLRVAAINQRLLAGSYTQFDTSVYNAHVNSLARLFAKLGVIGNGVHAPAIGALADYFASKGSAA